MAGFRVMVTVLALVALVASTASLGGCVMSPLRDRFATPPTLVAELPGGEPRSADPPASGVSESVGDRQAADGLFVGVALSGGGSRAAVFAAEVLRQLHDVGVMAHVDYISAVSGGTIAAGYYCLSRDPAQAGPRDLVWAEPNVNAAMAADFIAPLRRSVFAPWQWFLYLATGYNRSCAMADIMDAVVFGGRTVADLNPDRPRLLINTTRLREGQRFPLCDARLRELGVAPGSLRIADAVQASCAFPGLFHARAFPQFGRPAGSGSAVLTGYCHLIDGGVHDNSGVKTLLAIYDANRARFPRGAVILVVDSGRPLLAPVGTDRQPDIREKLDYLIDLKSAEMALDVILEANRLYLIEDMKTRAAHEPIRFVRFEYPAGVIASRGKEVRTPEQLGVLAPKRLLRVQTYTDPLVQLLDWTDWLKTDDVAPTSLNIEPHFAEETRRAASQQVQEQLPKINAAGLPTTRSAEVRRTAR